MTDITEMNLWRTILAIPNRIVTLAWKMLSVKGLALVGVFFLLKGGMFPGWEGVVLAAFTILLVIGGREADKWKRTFIEMKNGKLIEEEKES